MLKHIKRLMVPCLLLGALMLIIAGCGPGEKPAASPESSESPGTPAPEVVQPEVVGDDFITITSQDVRVGGEIVADRALYDAAVAEGEVIIYTAQSADHEMTVADVFKQQFPEINVEIMRLPGTRLHERYLTEWGAGIYDVDVIVQSEAGFFRRIADEGLLLENHPPSSHRFPDDKIIEGFVYPLHFSPMIIMYNSALVAEEDVPKDWPDLLDPKWKGAVGHTSIGGGSPYSMFLAIQKLHGWEFFEKLKENDPLIYPGGSAVVSGLTTGEVEVAALGIMSAYTAKQHMGAPIGFVYPESGAAPYDIVIGVAKSAPNPNAAKFYMNWYLSREGQSRITGIRGTHSYRGDVILSPGVKPFGQFNLFSHDINELYYDDEFRTDFINTWNRVMEFFE